MSKKRHKKLCRSQKNTASINEAALLKRLSPQERKEYFELTRSYLVNMHP